MHKSESIANLAKALTTFHVKVEKIKKDSKNPFFKSTYASLPNILESINEPLIESGLSITQFPTGDYGLTTLLMHESGEWIQSEYTMKPAKDDPQGRGSAITYQRRYAIASVLALNIDEDDDANLATHGKKEPKETQKQWLNAGTPEYVKAVQYVKDGGNIASIRAKYTISKPVEAELLQIISQNKMLQ